MPEESFGAPQIVEPKITNWPRIVLVAVLGIGLLIGAAYAGYYYGTQQAQPAKEPTSVVSQPTAKPTPTPTPATPTPEPVTPLVEDPTKGWETYTNTKYGYSIKYPPETKVQEGPGYEERVQETNLTLFGPKYQGPGEFTNGFGITLAVIKNPNNKTPTQFAQGYYKQAEEDINSKVLEGDISKCKVDSVTRSDTGGERFTYCTEAPGSGILNFSEWYVKNGFTYQIYAVLQNEAYLTTFNQILTTFKFLD